MVRLPQCCLHGDGLLCKEQKQFFEDERFHVDVIHQVFTHQSIWSNSFTTVRVVSYYDLASV